MSSSPVTAGTTREDLSGQVFAMLRSGRLADLASLTRWCEVPSGYTVVGCHIGWFGEAEEGFRIQPGGPVLQLHLLAIDTESIPPGLTLEEYVKRERVPLVFLFDGEVPASDLRDFFEELAITLMPAAWEGREPSIVQYGIGS
jgi:hypothetical protein